jgi:hypothetical protein
VDTGWLAGRNFGGEGVSRQGGADDALERE